jgi:hypothetical protein
MCCCESLLGWQWQTVRAAYLKPEDHLFSTLCLWSPLPSIYLTENCNPILPPLAFLRNCRLLANSTAPSEFLSERAIRLRRDGVACSRRVTRPPHLPLGRLSDDTRLRSSLAAVHSARAARDSSGVKLCRPQDSSVVNLCRNVRPAPTPLGAAAVPSPTDTLRAHAGTEKECHEQT